MAFTARTRQILLGIALAMTLTAVVWVHGQAQDDSTSNVDMPAKKARNKQTEITQGSAHLALGKLHRVDHSAIKVGDAFEA